VEQLRKSPNMSFSGAVKIADLSDFIAPAQSCVVSLSGSRLKTDDLDEMGNMDVGMPGVGVLKSSPLPKIEGPVKISLHDCLACSGCVTSAETILLEQQSSEEFMNQIKEEGRAVVVSISPQSIAALAVHFGLPPSETKGKVAGYLKQLGVQAVYDINTARDLALLETTAEFLHRFRSVSDGSSSTSTSSSPLPMLASACPGWVCYAEKTHGEYVLPYISATKSPQAVMGSLVKRHLAPHLNLSQVYHVAVMPCYDKKLEAARDDLVVPASSSPEVDCVLTTFELLNLMQDQKVEFEKLQAAPVDKLVQQLQLPAPSLPGPAQSQPPRQPVSPGGVSGSGGYFEYVFRSAARELYGVTVEGPLQYKTLRNTDFKEAVLEVEGKVVLRFGAVHGFRNIQNALRKIKTSKSEYHYLEIMACPSGCLNGGGQLKPVNDYTPKTLLEAVEVAYTNAQKEAPAPEENVEAMALYQHLLGGTSMSHEAKQLLHTQYHKREKTVSMQLNNW